MLALGIIIGSIVVFGTVIAGAIYLMPRGKWDS